MDARGINLIYSNAIYAVCVAGLTFAAGFVYRRIWHRLRGSEVTPTGFGVLLSFVLLGAAVVARASGELTVSLVVVVFAAVAYWFDDVIELSARVRILISFVAGTAVAGAFLTLNGVYSLLSTLGICFAVGFINVVFTNIVNFYDGADLNLTTFIVLTACLVLVFSPTHSEWVPIIVACLAFMIPFAVMNSRPRTIYLGDSGSFVFACMLTIMMVTFFENMQHIPAEFAIPAALPSLDVFFVLLIRIKEKHDLLTRNYLHLYQRLNRRFVGFGYLLPQIGNTLLCLAFANALQLVGFGRGLSVVFAMIIVTIPSYFVYRWVFLVKESEGASRLGHLP